MMSLPVAASVETESAEGPVVEKHPLVVQRRVWRPRYLPRC